MEARSNQRLEVIHGGGFGDRSQRPAATPDVPDTDAPEAGAHVDQLTGLPTERALEPVLEREWTLARRQAVSSILIVVDVDRFKRLNEDAGQKQGDRALKLVGRTLTDCCRATDFVARVGGDDFVVILVGAKGDQPAPYVERVNERLAAAERAPTLSYGWAKLINANTPAHAIDLANDLMYKRRAVSRKRAI